MAKAVESKIHILPTMQKYFLGQAFTVLKKTIKCFAGIVHSL